MQTETPSTLFRKAMWWIAGVSIELGKSFTSDRLVNLLKNRAIRNIVSFASSMTSWGGIISLAFDLADGNFDGYITVRKR